MEYRCPSGAGQKKRNEESSKKIPEAYRVCNNRSFTVFVARCASLRFQSDNHVYAKSRDAQRAMETLKD